jgi:hypothetical protein
MLKFSCIPVQVNTSVNSFYAIDQNSVIPVQGFYVNSFDAQNCFFKTFMNKT